MLNHLKFWICCGLILVALSAAMTIPAAGASIAYSIVDYPAYSTVSFGRIDSISGVIITDGTLGNIGSGNIIGGSFTITDPFAGSLTKPVLGNVSVTGTLFATLTDLKLFTPPSGTNALQLGDLFHTPYTVGNEYDLLTYVRTSGGNDGFRGTVATAIGPFSGAAFGWNFTAPNPTPLGGNDPWIIASVPEPSTLILAGVGFLLGLGLTRRNTKLEALIIG
ncbi:MAG: PEP-CTERM sorting domain-containing protein [Pirellulales bacterium]